MPHKLNQPLSTKFDEAMELASQLAGHKTITMAARYAHLSPDTVKVAAERID